MLVNDNWNLIRSVPFAMALCANSDQTFIRIVPRHFENAKSFHKMILSVVYL